MALVVQGTAARQGNANTVFYPLATKQRAGGAAAFHDTTGGNNSVPGQSGFNAGTGYDQATGLGSVDTSVLVSHWSDGNIVPTFHLAASTHYLSVTAGSNTSVNNSVTLSVTVSGGFNAAVAFSVIGLPPGVTAAFTPATLSAPGSGSSVLKLTATSATKPGVYSATAAATSGSSKQTLSLAVTVMPGPTFTLASSETSISLAAGASKSLTLTTTPTSTFNAAITLAVTGLPAGMTVQILPSSVVAAPGTGAPVVTFSASSKVAAKSYSITLTATGGGVTQKQTLTVNVGASSLASTANAVTVSSTAKGTLRFTTVPLRGLSSPITFGVSGLPTGVTASFTPRTAARGSGSSTLTLTKRPGAAVGTSHFTVTATGESLSQTTSITLTVK
jgi:hypothetical protein